MAVPALLGLVLAGGVFTAFGFPIWKQMNQQGQRLVELQGKRDTLPLLEAQLKQSDKTLGEVMQQQALLVDLVAGRGQIQTFLAQLSRISVSSGVVISLYEPVPLSSLEASNSIGQDQQSKTDDSAGASKDPLQTLGYEKSVVLLQVEGPYQGLLQFLRQMELLELLVQPSDLELKAVSPETNADGAPVGPPLTELKLRLSFFDKITAGDQDANEPVESAPQSSVRAPS